MKLNTYVLMTNLVLDPEDLNSVLEWAQAMKSGTVKVGAIMQANEIDLESFTHDLTDVKVVLE